MLTELWKSYEDGDYRECLRFAAETTVKHYGIDTLAAAGASLIQLRRIDEGMHMLKAAAAFRPDEVNLYHFACAITNEYVLADELEYFVTLGLRDFPDDVALQRFQAATKFLKMDPTAFAYYESILHDDPTDIHAHLNLAVMHRALSHFDQTERHYAAAYDIDPENVSVAIGRASLHLDHGRSAEARALLEPHRDNPDVQFLLATDALARGDYQTGWSLYQSRWNTAVGKSHTKPPRPFSDLSEIKNKRVAVLREGGHGDVIQFARYIPLLAAQAAEVLLFVFPSELRLLRHNMPANVTLKATTEMPEDYEYTTALFDLPYHFRTTIETIPAAPYLTVPVFSRLPPTAKKRIGVCWAGGAQINVNDRSHDRHRSIRLNQLASLGDFSDNIEFINLQAGARGNDTGLPMTRVLEDGFDWLDTAGIIAQLDLVITVDTAVVHVAGALGRPTWLLSRFNPCWRWLGNRPDGLWYPGIVRVFGQTAYDDWVPVIARLHDELAVWALNPR